MATSTITGRVIDITGTNRACAIVFTPTATPIASSPSLITSFVRTIYSAEDGTFSLTLTEGDYNVTFAGADSLTISVPETAGSYDLLTLITSEVVWNPSTVGLFALLKANNLSDLANFATARTNLDVYSKAQVDALVAGGGFIGTANRAVVTNGSGALASSAVTATEVGYLAGVTSLIQTQLDAKQATITGGASTIATTDLTINRALVSNGSGKVVVSAVTATELGYVSGVTSALQTQLGAKQATLTGAATTIASADLTASRLLVSNGSGKVAVSSVTSTEAGYLSGVTSAIQTQLGAKLSLSGGAMTGDFRVFGSLYFYNTTPGVDEANIIWNDTELNFSHKITGPEFFFGGGTIDDALSVSGNISAGHYIMPDAIEVSGSDVDGATGSVFRKEVETDATINLLNIKNGQTLVLEVCMNAEGPYTITWAFPGTNLIWAGAITPTPTAGLGGGAFTSDVYAFVRVGGNIFGSVVQNYTYET